MEKLHRSLALTGHRPTKLFATEPYSEANYQHLCNFYTTVVWPSCLDKIEIDEVISGMALGVDQAGAESALHAGITCHLAIPFASQPDAWSRNQQSIARYNAIKMLNHTKGGTECIGHPNPTTKFEAAKFLNERNEYMVDRLGTDGFLIALWDGTQGGTGNCVAYAVKKGVRVINFYPLWLKYKAENGVK